MPFCDMPFCMFNASAYAHIIVLELSKFLACYFVIK
jgi:hypothetical protein